MKKIIIAAVSKNNVIGNHGKLPWHSKEELLHFKTATSGYPIIMGRKTWDAISKPLSNRINIVVTRNKNFSTSFDEVLIYNSLESIWNEYFIINSQKVFVIGGGELFNQAIETADEIILSVMKMEAEGDVFFPKIDLTKWLLNSIKDYTEFTVHHYIRVSE